LTLVRQALKASYADNCQSQKGPKNQNKLSAVQIAICLRLSKCEQMELVAPHGV
jgi:hypothetical protein